jgi:DNA-binding HxlR family transcriptional regulator
VDGYGQFCAVARALEVLGQRWTLLVVRELLCGATRFTEIRRGIPLIPRSTLIGRLTELERAGVVARTTEGYALTDAGRALSPVLGGLAGWAHAWDRRGLTDSHLDPETLLWDIRRRLRPEALPAQRTVVGFVFTDRPAADSRLWLHLGGGEPALCRSGAGFDADLEVHGDTRPITRWWLGELRWPDLLAAGAVRVTGPRDLQRAFPRWFAGYAFPAH